jgi:hypothetical protein
MEEITNQTDQDSGVQNEQATATTVTAPAAAIELTGMNVLDPNFTGLPPWEAADYAASITGSGAWKLADSGVAPLVAAARGYTRIDKTNYDHMARKMQVVGNSGQGKRFKRTLSAPGKDGMVMPWYSLAGIVKAKREGERPVPHTYQVRPEFPENNEAGKPLKYEFVSNIGTPLDLHPAIPTDWIDTTPVVMFAEGMLKGDSALSAYLVHNGISYSELRSEGVENPVAKLRELLERIPQDERVLIVSIGGVYNASGNAVDWREITLKDRIGWIAFDADIAINPAVHAAANKLSTQLLDKSKMTEVLYLNPQVAANDDGSTTKDGVDDFLAKRGNWAALINQLDDVMPDAPVKNAEDKPGNWRVGKGGQFVEECVAVNNGAGGTIGEYRWERRVEIGGRVVAMEARRQPTDQELKTGIFDPNVKFEDIDDAQVEIEVSWHLHGRDYTATVTGPETILGYKPEEWDRKKASVPRELLLHPEWPPRGAKGESWLSAIKSNRPDEVAFKTRWMQMGWVPVQDGDPVFLIGDQIVGDVESSSNVLPGISSKEIDVIQKYGVGENISGDYDDEEYREEVRKNFRTIMDTYVNATAWTDLSTSTVVLAGALRPVIPIRPKATIYIWGPKGKGKAIPVTERIPVPVSAKFPTGWALNSELELGDEVYSADGSVTAIRTFSDVFEDDVYEFDLSDGRTVRSSSQHLWKVSSAASRAARAASAKKATGFEARRVKAERLRQFAATLASGDAAPLPDLVLATGFSREQVTAAVSAAGIQYQDVMLSGDVEDSGLTWVDLPVDQLAGYIHGRTASFSELAEVQRQVSEGKHYTSGKFGTVRVAKSRVYPVAETLAALADHVEFTRAPMPLEKTVTAETIAADFAAARYGIRAIEAVDGPEAVLPVPAYTLGAWLGDGTSREGGFTNPDAEVIDWIRADGYQVTDCTRDISWYIRGLMQDLRDLDVLENKHIPARYLRGSRAQRLALLQGLMDTDGTVSKQGQCELTLTTERLAQDAVELIRSFGIRARICESDATISENGVRRVVGTRYRIQFTTTEPVFRLSRKAARLPEKQLENWVFIEDVRKVGSAPVRCLTVQHPTGMFAQDDFVLSHNSWTAECMMRFWARHRGDWHEELPGSAKDTAAAMENAVARTPIWVIDDLAPSAVRRQAEQEDAKLADITRAIFNNATKLRMNADMTVKKSNKPMTQLIMTGENELSTPSAKERLIPLYVGKGKLNPERTPTDALNDIASNGGIPARFTSQLIKYVRYAATTHPGGWAAYVAAMEAARTQLKDQISGLMKDMGASSGSLERTSTLAADVMLTFFILENLARELDMDDDFIDQFAVDGDMSMSVIQLVTNAHAENQQAAPGISLVKALAALLASGEAHVISGDDPSRPPIEGTEQSEAMVNSRLGWVVSGGGDGSLRPSGKNIGTVVTVKNKSTMEYHKVVLFSSDTAFSAAQKAYPSLIQFGQGPTAAWSSVWDENLQPPFITRIKNGRGTLLATWRKDRITGVPIEVNRLLDGGLSLEDLPEASTED